MLNEDGGFNRFLASLTARVLLQQTLSLDKYRPRKPPPQSPARFTITHHRQYPM
jgi:hypothetical protein